ncbi:hypothetical protein [Tepidimicrobium xylanilyticum]|uniref:Uncharacterized protein n=1 Tax=Tepidimicrobium xylanilyticum TaxID=1123352 RepID=A0A1H2SWJ6_9FIRM|nr:hypothetical protein [Tepidimicrobium xylanilyticum]SDW36066.1 hypothetical protein SAMN05660923_00569 [Tepidimicrobium xylanilyticum]
MFRLLMEQMLDTIEILLQTMCTLHLLFRKGGNLLFQRHADTRSNELGTNVHGLFAAIIVEEAESTWFDPVTGEPLESGLFADIYHPTKPTFMEYIVFFHDKMEIKDKNGETPINPNTNLPSSAIGVSYRSEPM